MWASSDEDVPVKPAHTKRRFMRKKHGDVAPTKTNGEVVIEPSVSSPIITGDLSKLSVVNTNGPRFSLGLPEMASPEPSSNTVGEFDTSYIPKATRRKDVKDLPELRNSFSTHMNDLGDLPDINGTGSAKPDQDIPLTNGHTSDIEINRPAKSPSSITAPDDNSKGPVNRRLRGIFPGPKEGNTPRGSVKSAGPMPRVTSSLTTLDMLVTARLAAKKMSAGVKERLATDHVYKLPCEELRKREHLVGATGALGKKQLDRVFPKQQCRIFVGTWNMAEHKADEVDDFLLPPDMPHAAEVFVIGTQESCSDKRAWAVKLQETLGPNFVQLSRVVNGALCLIVFVRRELLWFTSSAVTGTLYTTAAKQPISTKGCCATSFNIFGTSLLFLTSHFSAGEDKTDARITDYKKTITNLKMALNVQAEEGMRRAGSLNSVSTMGSETGRGERDITSNYDVCFWCGDFNFRVQKQRTHVDKIIEGSSEWSVLLSHDELSNLRNTNQVFANFQEGRINFAPTYKLDPGSGDYDQSSKQRIQSWTDRVLFRCQKKNSVSCVLYNSSPAVKYSDHSPVYAMFEVKVEPFATAKLDFAFESFDRDVYIQGNRQRAQLGDSLNSKTCVLQ